jgi:hypothetical protein
MSKRFMNGLIGIIKSNKKSCMKQDLVVMILS